ncbi:unnamed protein product [Calypogeia fissa]
MPEEGDSSSTDASSSDSSTFLEEEALPEEEAQPEEEAPRTADQVMRDQDAAIDNFMEDWFGDNVEDNVLGHSPDGGLSPNDPQPRHRPEGQQEWEEAQHHARTPIYEGARLSRLSAILGLLNI